MTCGVKKTKNRILRGIGTALVCLGVVCAALLAWTEMTVRPKLQNLLDYKCRMSAERIISNAVFDSLKDGEDPGSIVSFTFGENGQIAALSVDRSRVNSLKAMLGDAVNRGIESLGSEYIGISVGSLTGMSLLYGNGGELRFRVEPKGAAETVLRSSFTSAGINQTIHTIILEVDADLTPTIPGYRQEVRVTYDILLAETVIVGSVPESYSHIVLDEEHLSELADIDI